MTKITTSHLLSSGLVAGAVLFGAVPISFAVPAAPRIGLYTGTFDPPHEGHRAVIETAVRELKLDEILVVPNEAPEWKPNATPVAVRIELAKKAFGHVAHVRVATPEESKHLKDIQVAALLGELSAARPEADVFHVMGDDSFEGLRKRESLQFPARVTFAVSVRELAPERIPSRLGDHDVLLLNPKEEGLSSSLVRKMYAEGKVIPAKILAPSVQDEIFARHLYGARLTCSRVFNPYEI